jgi:hypothetical protein
MSDLLDMSNHRVSKVILNHNITNMGKTSRFHWISHILTRGYKLDVKYDLNDKKERNILQRDNIIETISLKKTVAECRNIRAQQTDHPGMIDTTGYSGVINQPETRGHP